MKLYHSQTSPYVRKCMFIAHHLGLADRIEKLPSAAHPVNRDQSIIPSNPLGKVPTMITDDGTVLFDSRVICEYLDHLGKGSFFPAAGAERWRVLTEQALADGILDAALLSATRARCGRRTCAGPIGRPARWTRSTSGWRTSRRPSTPAAAPRHRHGDARLARWATWISASAISAGAAGTRSSRSGTRSFRRCRRCRRPSRSSLRLRRGVRRLGAGLAIVPRSRL